MSLTLKRKSSRNLEFLLKQQEAREWIEETLNIKIKQDDLYVKIILIIFIKITIYNRNH